MSLLQDDYNRWRRSGGDHSRYVEENGIDPEVGERLKAGYEQRAALSVLIVPRGADLCTLTVEKDGAVVGHLRLYIMEEWWDGGPTGKKKANIQDVWVHPDHRGKGHGRFLMEVAHEKARGLGCHLVELTSSPDNPEREVARQMYLRMGYEIKTDGFRLKLEE